MAGGRVPHRPDVVRRERGQRLQVPVFRPRFGQGNGAPVTAVPVQGFVAEADGPHVGRGGPVDGEQPGVPERVRNGSEDPRRPVPMHGQREGLASLLVHVRRPDGPHVVIRQGDHSVELVDQSIGLLIGTGYDRPRTLNGCRRQLG